MELRIHYTALPQGMEEDRFKLELAQVLDEEGWLTGSGTSDSGFWRHPGRQALPPAQRLCPGYRH